MRFFYELVQAFRSASTATASPCAFHASKPPTTFITWVKPLASRMLAPSADAAPVEAQVRTRRQPASAGSMQSQFRDEKRPVP